MENAYKTMDQDYMESVMWVFKTMWDKEMVYKGQRVSLYSWKLSTPISNFEVAMDDSYEEVSDPAITVMFPVHRKRAVGIELRTADGKALHINVKTQDFGKCQEENSRNEKTSSKQLKESYLKKQE